LQDLTLFFFREARKDWAKSINTILAAHGEELNDTEWLDAELTSEDELEW